MKVLEDYMNDPSISHLQMPLREVKAIRLMIHDETKDMTSSEVTAYYKKGLEDIQTKHGFKFNIAASAK